MVVHLRIAFISQIAALLFFLSTQGVLLVAQEIRLEKLETPASVPGQMLIRKVLPGAIPDATTEYITIVGPGRYEESDHVGQEVVWLFLGGTGSLRVNDLVFELSEESIAYAPETWKWRIEVPKEEVLIALRITRRLSEEDRKDLADSAYATNNAKPYVKTFKECIPYGESIKSRKTVSRTLLPADFIPRMSIGTVETSGPDQVGRHKHPMLEQLFLGLKSNNSTVTADEATTSFPPLSILHIPSGSMHGSQVQEGNKLYYVWMDFFSSREGQVWLKNHKPITEEPSGRK